MIRPEMTGWEPDDDALRPAVGIVWAALFALLLWVAIFCLAWRVIG